MQPKANGRPVLPAALLGSSAYLIVRIRRHLYRRLSEQQSRLGLRIGHGAILTCLDEAGPMNQREIGAMLGTDASEVVRCIDWLERESLITRHSDEDDRRRNLLNITDAGREMAAHFQETMQAVEREVFGFLSNDENTQLQALLEKVAMADIHSPDLTDNRAPEPKVRKGRSAAPDCTLTRDW